MKKINIFLGSSIVELSEERLILENFIRNVSDGFEERYNIKLQPLLCENFDDAYTEGRKQEEYNKKIRESELCFFIFFTKAGQYTVEEFEIARKAFEQSGKPKIYTYFKNVEEGKLEDSLVEFKKMLDQTLGHYYGMFDHIDTVKLRVLLSIKLSEMDFVELKTEGGVCTVDGEDVMSLKNVSEFVNNQELAKMQSELYKCEEEYNQMQPIYAAGGCDEAFYKRYSLIAARRESIKKSIDELQKLIFNMSLRMVKDEVHGDITIRQKEAYRLFELGDYNGCIAVLDEKDIDDDFLQARNRLDNENKAVCKKYINEHKTAIDILSVMTDYKNRFSEIESRYEKIVPLALEEKIEMEAVYDYCCFLREQNKQAKAIAIAERLADAFEAVNEEADVMGGLYNLMALCYKAQMKVEKAEQAYLNSKRIFEEAYEINPEKYRSILAGVYSNLGIFYSEQKNEEEAKHYCLEAIELYKKVENKKAKDVEKLAALLHNNAGAMYFRQRQWNEAKLHYEEAVKIREELENKNPGKYRDCLAGSYLNLGTLYYSLGQNQAAERYFFNALRLQKKLAEENPERYAGDLAMIYNNIGALCYKNRRMKEAETYYLNSIAMYELLVALSPQKYNEALAGGYNNMAILYQDLQCADKTEEYSLKELKIREELAEKNPQRYEDSLAKSYISAGEICCKCNNDDEAEKYYLQALKILKKLAEKNAHMYAGSLAGHHNDLGIFYEKQGELEMAEVHYSKAIDMQVELAGEDFEKYGADLAVSYFNFAIFKKSDEYFNKALKIAKTQPDNPYCRQIIDSLENREN